MEFTNRSKFWCKSQRSRFVCTRYRGSSCCSEGRGTGWDPNGIIAKFRENSVFAMMQREDIDLETVTIRSSKWSNRSTRALKDRMLAKARRAERTVKEIFHRSD